MPYCFLPHCSFAQLLRALIFSVKASQNMLIALTRGLAGNIVGATYWLIITSDIIVAAAFNCPTCFSCLPRFLLVPSDTMN